MGTSRCTHCFLGDFRNELFTFACPKPPGGNSFTRWEWDSCPSAQKAASAPWRPSHAGPGDASYKVVPKTVKFGGFRIAECSQELPANRRFVKVWGLTESTGASRRLEGRMVESRVAAALGCHSRGGLPLGAALQSTASGEVALLCLCGPGEGRAM